MKSKFYHVLLLVLTILMMLSGRPTSATPLASVNQLLSPCGSAYTVRSGDTLGGIAARCGVSLASLLSANGLRSTSIIYPGQRLTIPGGGAALAAPPGTAASGRCTNPYIVRAGDTLGRVAAQCGVSVALLKQWNGLTSDVIRVGQRLYLRAVAPVSLPYRPAPTPGPKTNPPTSGIAPQPTPTPRIDSPISPWW